ncbi:MAG TPA: CocE/NonD family hydrolase [Chlamydiales bacterium]|nr:CocE/NonD family hydrolase [Chlamydiales bacterium]
MSIENICFETSWNDSTIHLAPQAARDRITQIAIDVFSILFPPLGIARLVNYAVVDFANRLALPAAQNMRVDHVYKAVKNFYSYWNGPIKEENRFIRENYHLVEQTVLTPDKVAIKAICLQHNDCAPDMPTVIYFNGNFQLCIETPTWILEESLKNGSPCNLVLFDYRGVGESLGQFKRTNDLVIDGYSVVEWVREKIGTRPENIHFYGFSLGGAIATLTKALDPECLTGRLINDRSFSSSDRVLNHRYGFLGKLLHYIFDYNGYSADVSANFAKVSGEKMVIYHPDDDVIPFDAGMHLMNQQDELICLQPKPTLVEESKAYNHVAPLNWHETAVERVMDFLFPREVAEVVV